MSMTQAVVRIVREKGSATVPELHAELPEYTVSQIWNAVKNCRTLGYIHCLGRTPKVPGTNRYQHARHYPGAKPRGNAPSPFPQAPVAPPASVWQLADRPQMQWPPAGEGRRFNLLGGWDDLT